MLYVDPGLGSLLWQVIASAVVGSVFAFRRTLASLARSFRRGHPKNE